MTLPKKTLARISALEAAARPLALLARRVGDSQKRAAAAEAAAAFRLCEFLRKPPKPLRQAAHVGRGLDAA